MGVVVETIMQCYIRLVICQRHMGHRLTAIIFGNNSGISEAIAMKFYLGTRRTRRYAPLQTSGALRQAGAKWWRKTRIFRTFCHRNNTSFPPLLDGRFPWNLNTKSESLLWILLGSIAKFFDKGPFTPTTSFKVGPIYTSGPHAPALVFRSRANLSIALYSGVFLPATLFVRITVFEKL